MGRFVAGCAFIALLVLAPAAFAADPRVIATRCEESEIVLDAHHSVSALGRCSDNGPIDVLWHLDRLDQAGGNLDGHFTRTSRGEGVTIYVVDTGVLATHDEFTHADGTPGSRVVAGYDVSSSVPFGASTCTSANKAVGPCIASYDELTASSHGTGVASIAAGKNIGVAPDATIVSVRVMNERGLATTRTYLDGLAAIIHDAWSSNAPVNETAVVNISGWVLDHLTSSPSEQAVPYATVERKMRDMVAGVDAAGKRDPAGHRFLFVVAGNNIDGGCGPTGVVDRFPAVLGRRVNGIITVGGMTSDNVSWAGSCRGGVEVLAPAEDVFSATITGNDHYRGRNVRSGTSFAAPVIAGEAALLIAQHPTLTPEQLEAWITTTPSRVVNPETALAQGKVAFLFSGEPPVVATTLASGAVTTAAR